MPSQTRTVIAHVQSAADLPSPSGNRPSPLLTPSHTRTVAASPCPPVPASLPLSPLQVQAANLLAAGQSPTEVARALSVGRATLYRWQQDVDFAAYFNQLVRERSTEVTALASRLATRSLRLIEQKLDDPNTPVELQLRLAFRILALYSRPSFLGHLSALPDDPKVIAQIQMQHELKITHQPPLPDIDGGDIELYRAMKDRSQEDAAFDAAYPDPEAAVPAKRDTLRHNETPGAPTPTPASPKPQPRPASAKPQTLAMRHNETLSAAPCAAAIDAALSGLRQGIAQAT